MLNIHNYPDITFPGNFIWEAQPQLTRSKETTFTRSTGATRPNILNGSFTTQERHATATVSTKRMWNC